MTARVWARVALVVVTVVCAWLTVTRLRLSGDLSTLFPSSGDAAALSRWTRAFGGRDPVLVLVRGGDADRVSGAADAVAEALRHAPSIERVLDHAPRPAMPGDPTLAWAYAGPAARARLASIVTPAGMHDRLEDTRALLLAPTADEDEAAWLARDPLRLAQAPWEDRPPDVLSGVAQLPGGALVADDGRARLVVAEPRGSSFDSASAAAVVDDVERAEAAAARPGVTMEVAGGHAIARATEQMLRRDLQLSSAVSMVLASIAFVVTFRRVRALVAVLPPLVLGTLWTTGIAALFPSGLDAVAIAFAAVVVGVGVDTGVHVYSALLDARRAGLAPDVAARAAREATWRQTLTAALVAAVAFGSLALGGLRAMSELGVLCAAGEVLTAVAILLVTPEIGSWLERGPTPPASSPRWIEALAWATATRGRAAVSVGLCALPIVIVAVAGWPRPADALVAIRPQSMAPIVAEEHVRALFGGRSDESIVLTADPDEERARTRADRVAESLEPLVRDGTVDGFDALSALAPSDTTVRARLAEREALDLPARRDALAAALRAAGFDLDACRPALDAFAHPAPGVTTSAADDAGLVWLLARHVAHDAGDTVVATYVRPGAAPDARDRIRAAIAAVDPTTAVTGIDAIERELRSALSRDLLRVGGVALLLVALAMRVALRSTRHAVVALATLACEMGVVGVAMRVLSVRWHVYDALVVPVLFGVTIDESMFMLHAARTHPIEDVLRKQGPLVSATALTTAAGFAALIGCQFPGLRDLGTVGVIGVLAGLVAALVIVPGALRVLGRP